MAVIKLQVSTNFSTAQKSLESMGEATEKEAARMKTAMAKLSGTQLDSFIQKNTRAAAAVEATDGKLAGLATQSRGLKTQIQKMIRAGYDPQSEALQQLQKEYADTTKQIELNKQATADNTTATKASKTAMVAMGAAVVAAGAAMIKGTFSVAEAGDEYAKTARTIGITAESLQELQFVADRSGVSNENLNTALQKLNKNIGDVRAGTGTLTTLLKAQNPELLEQLKNVKSNDEAFALLTEEIGNMENVTDRATLAQGAFGRAGQDLINVASLGADGIAELRLEAQSYGLVSNEAAAASEKFIDAQTNAIAAVTGLKNAMAEKLMPAITNIMTGFTDFVTDVERVNKVLNIMLPILAAVAAGIATFLILTQATAIIQGMATAMRVLNLVFLQNPIVLVIMAIVAVSVLLYRNWDKVVVLFQTTIAKLQARFEQFGSAIKTSWLRAFNSIKIVVLELAGVIIDKAMWAINKLLNLASKIPIIGEKFAGLQENVNGFSETLNQARLDAIAQSEDTVAAAKQEQVVAKETADAKVAAIKEESVARLAALKEQEQINAEMSTTIDAPETEINVAVVDADIATYDAEIIAYEEFLAKKAELDAAAASQRAAVRKAEIEATGGLFSALSDLVTAYGEDNEAAVLASKALASTSAAINSYLAFTQVLADATIPSTFVKVATAGTVLASGLATQKNIWSAETGGSFTVPDSSRVDGSTIAVNQGENVEVTPRGESSSKSITVNAMVDSSVIWSVVQDGFDEGEITISNDNLRAG